MYSRISMGLLMLTLSSAAASAQGLQVRHDHDPWGSCEGELIVTVDGIRYEADKEEHSRVWSWSDVQGFDRKSATEFSLLTYEDLTWHVGLDKNYDFTTLVNGEALDPSVFEMIGDRISRPITDRIPRTVEAEYQVEVKHLHVFGGCEGTLTFGSDWIVYETDHTEDARSWRRDTHVANVWSSNPYELELRILEENQRAFDKATRFTFQLKEPLDQPYYETLRRKYLLAR